MPSFRCLSTMWSSVSLAKVLIFKTFYKPGSESSNAVQTVGFFVWEVCSVQASRGFVTWKWLNTTATLRCPVSLTVPSRITSVGQPPKCWKALLKSPEKRDSGEKKYVCSSWSREGSSVTQMKNGLSLHQFYRSNSIQFCFVHRGAENHRREGYMFYHWVH